LLTAERSHHNPSRRSIMRSEILATLRSTHAVYRGELGRDSATPWAPNVLRLPGTAHRLVGWPPDERTHNRHAFRNGRKWLADVQGCTVTSPPELFNWRSRYVH